MPLENLFFRALSSASKSSKCSLNETQKNKTALCRHWSVQGSNSSLMCTKLCCTGYVALFCFFTQKNKERQRERERVRERGETDGQRYTQREQVFRSRITVISRSNIRTGNLQNRRKLYTQ